MGSNLNAPTRRNRHGRGRNPAIHTAKSGTASHRHLQFHHRVETFLAMLHQENPELLNGVRVILFDTPDSKQIQSTKWVVDTDTNSVTLFRVPLERASKEIESDAPFQLHRAEMALLLALSELLDVSPWELFRIR
ncbi:MAG: hypothetical protein KF916_05370 [Microbacteriaceae bacterium]|nr:hypothetical protein [Microbacteriaceae bacterium]